MKQHIKDWCYAECERQHATTPADIAGMEDAWATAKRAVETGQPVGIWLIGILAERIDPVANPEGRFRTGPAVFMNGGTAAPTRSIEKMLTMILMVLEEGGLTPEEFYQELMYIHPFKDGNGRMGALVYNILNGTVDSPVTPPEYR